MTAQEFIKYLQKKCTLEERKEKELLVSVSTTSEGVKEIITNGPCILNIILDDEYYQEQESNQEWDY